MRTLSLAVALPLSLPGLASTLIPRQSPAATPTVAFLAPTGTPTTCGNLTASWAWKSLPSGTSSLFALLLVPSSPTAGTTSISGLTSTSRAAPSGTPGPGLSGRADPAPASAATTVQIAEALQVPAGSFVWTNAAAPPGWYVLSGIAQSTASPSMQFVNSPPFQIAAGPTFCLASTPISTSAAPARPSPTETQQGPPPVSKKRVKAGVIAGAVLGAFALTFLLIGALALFRTRRARAVQSWRDERAKQWDAFAAPRASSTAHGHGADEKAVDDEAVEDVEDRARQEAELRAALRASGIQGGVEATRRPPVLADQEFRAPGA